MANAVRPITRITRLLTFGASYDDLLLPPYLANRSITSVHWVGRMRLMDDTFSRDSASDYLADLRLMRGLDRLTCAVMISPTHAPTSSPQISAKNILAFGGQHAAYERVHVPRWLVHLDGYFHAFRDPRSRSKRSYCWVNEAGPWTFVAPEHPSDWRIRARRELSAHVGDLQIKRHIEAINRHEFFSPSARLTVEYHR